MKLKICAIKILWRCPFRWHPFLLASKSSDFGLNAWTIVHGFDRISLHTHNSSLEGGMELKFVPFCSSLDALSDDILFCRSQNFQILAENHGL